MSKKTGIAVPRHREPLALEPLPTSTQYDSNRVFAFNNGIRIRSDNLARLAKLHPDSVEVRRAHKTAKEAERGPISH